MDLYLLFVPLNFAAAAVLAFGINWLSAIPWRRAAAAHWTERARLLWPVRRCGSANIYLISAGLVVAETGPNWETPPQWYILQWIAGFLGAILGTFPLDKEAFPRFSFRSWLRLVAVSWTLRIGIWIIFIGCTILMPDEPGGLMAAIAVGYLIFVLAWSWGLYVRTMRLIGVLKDPGERLWGIVAATARRTGVSEPGAWLMDLPFALAYALPVTREVMFSNRLLDILSDDEISSVCAHELAHLSESKSTMAGRVITSLALYPVIFFRPAMRYGPSAVCAICGLILLLSTFGRKLSRRMEVRADKMAAESQAEEGVYARALEKLYCDSAMPAVMPGNHRAHPHLYDRMLAAGIQPDYPRPNKPQGIPWTMVVVWAGFGVLIGYILAQK